MKYQFDNITVTNPSIDIAPIIDDNKGLCTIKATLSSGAMEAIITIGVMPYENDTWTTADVEAFVAAQMAAREVQE